ncbi:MAG: alpha/beta hydrolase [Verrucomicrobia bacterium]|nr:alpha/beta hydrolase [Verrucomicrobiota bacterium]MBU1736027.1 alpha/beta hydrolase [Verrucomicrobiota bacterium]MBU1858123.1 alpha/beta hydrolase [Verrucomicrobiota bacterium]
MSDVIRIALSVLKIVAAVYVGLCILLFFRQSHMVYFPLVPVMQKPSDVGLAYESVALMTADDTRLAGWYVPCEGARGTVLMCHGNGGNIGDRLHPISLFHGLGLNVLVFDYRGYGESTGKPSEEGTYQDARAAWQYLTEKRNTPPDKIVVFGRSLGGAVAAGLVERITPAALILEATFTSIPDMGARLYPWLPIRLLSRYRYNTLARLEQIHCPVLIAHSRDDEMIPFEQGQRLFAAAHEPKTFFELTGDHNEGEALTSPAYCQALDAFLTGQLGSFCH